MTRNRLPPEDRLPRQGPFATVVPGECLYRNSLATPADVADWRLEGRIATAFPNGRLRLESVLPAGQGQKANFVMWCPVVLPDGVCIEFDFHPVQEPGLAMFWFCARGRQGEDLFDPRLPARSGEYDQYRYGAIDAYHAAFFRRGRPGAFQICNLRKSHGFHLVAQGGDPIPSGTYEPPYRIRVLVQDGWVQFEIDDLVIYTWHDDSPLRGGRIGFRQMAPLVAEYADLTVWTLEPAGSPARDPGAALER
jgi:hypothetical protein